MRGAEAEVCVCEGNVAETDSNRIVQLGDIMHYIIGISCMTYLRSKKQCSVVKPESIQDCRFVCVAGFRPG